MNNLLTLIDNSYKWGVAVGIAFTAASLAVLLIQFIYSRS